MAKKKKRPTPPPWPPTPPPEILQRTRDLTTTAALGAELRQAAARIAEHLQVMAAARDRLRDLVADFEQLHQTWAEAVEDCRDGAALLRQGLEQLQRGLDQASEQI